METALISILKIVNENALLIIIVIICGERLYKWFKNKEENV